MLLLGTATFADTPVSGSISSDTTWDLAGSPFIVTGDLNIQAGAQLLISGPVTVTNLLMGGFSQQVSINWVMPNDGLPHTVYVVVDPALSLDDRDRSNNAGSLPVLLPDLQPVACWSSEVSTADRVLVARIQNSGNAVSGNTDVSWRIGSATGTELGRTPLGGLAAGEITEVAFAGQVPASAYTNGFAAIYAVVDSTNAVAEADESNNQAWQIVSATQSGAAAITGCSVQGGMVKLTFVVAGLPVSSSVIESTSSLTNGAVWNVETTASVTNTAPGVFEATVPVLDSTGFYRLHWGP